MSYVMELVLVFSLIISLSISEFSRFHFTAVGILEGRVCSPTLRVFETRTSSVIGCAHVCGNTNACGGVSYQHEICYGCAIPFDATGNGFEQLDGAISYQKTNNIYNRTCIGNADCSAIDGICTESLCRCSPNMFYDLQQIKCSRKFKLAPGTGGNGVNTGQLMAYYNEEWGNVHSKYWTWTSVKAVCQDINPNFVFGGAFHPTSVYGSGPDSSPSYEMEIDCGSGGDKTSIADCTLLSVTDCDHDKDLGLTCYDTDVSANVRLNKNFTKDDDEITRLEVFYDGTWGTVCGEKWSKEEADVACRTIQPNTKKKDDCTNSCAGGPLGPYMVTNIVCGGHEPHLFYCEN